ncbi:hypothetical protein [Microbacterium oleivorans]|uniref:hypothetical protein n=1 Tax=Microbacterium oleivorans TaxID=273677 RepID=UPI00203BB05B|nr:hypothetical protein [Microbacterium oleivorans]MCM3695996.1 hypothetical protein [Microbacterium oleivorans]
MKRAGVWGVGILLLVAAWFVTQVTPGQELTESSFIQTVAVGDHAVGREMIVTVTDVGAADALSDANGWSAEGNWVFVDADVESRSTEISVRLGLAVLVIDGVTYRASERPEASLLGRQLEVGVPTSGSLAFELPADLRRGDAVIRLTVDDQDWRLDSVVELPVELGQLPRDDDHELAALSGGGV